MEFNIPFNRPRFEGLVNTSKVCLDSLGPGGPGKSIIFLAQAVETRQLKEIISGVYIHCFAFFFTCGIQHSLLSASF